MKKFKGSIVGPMLISMLTAMFCILFIEITINAVIYISNSLKVYQISRKYSLKAESYGCLTMDDEEDIKNRIGKLGVKNISFSGTTTNKSNYGDNTSLVIHYDQDIKLYAFNSVIKISTDTVNVPIDINSTAKD